ncbi:MULTISPECIES: glycosyltransferase family 9 protein [Aeromonas]|uniref:glycosyltransferase family 9 protein n=1 Tax=Aeromonas TaxID=642 RepID=UPI00200019E1|nr:MULTISPECIES: glycosyltransferase family 9 protein [Aeromonas]UPK55515.1 lipopolysaccharide heptosyltransferase family protein [Aeromonas veronii]
MIKKLQLWRDIIRRKIGIMIFDRPVTNSLYEQRGATVFVRWDAKLGDAIVSSWVAREIKKKYPMQKVIAITSPDIAHLFREYFEFDEVFCIPKRPSYNQLASLASSLGNVDYLVHFSKSMKMKDMYFIKKANPKHVIGIDDDLQCVDIKLGKKTENVHFSIKFSEALKSMGVGEFDSKYIIPYFTEDEMKVREHWPKVPTICFNPYGSGSSRVFNKENVLNLIDIMLAESDFNICLLYPPNQLEEIDRIISMMSVASKERVFIYNQPPSLGALFAQVRASVGMVSVDTATVHISAGLGKPILGIYNDNFGMPENKEWLPNCHNSKVLYVETNMIQSVNYINLDKFRAMFIMWSSLCISRKNTY